ncbi:MAG: SulP family inorganic anion transporter [Myxococcales bacterium]
MGSTNESLTTTGTSSSTPRGSARAARASALSTPSPSDLKSGLIVFLVALPLCLGVATASGAPPLAGLIAGVVGGTLVGLASGSALSVSGPAAGLTVIVLDGITRLGMPAFLMATLLGGGIQLTLGALRLGRFAQLVPNVVIRGMLAAIGLILLLKQLPHAVGYDADPEGDFAFEQLDGHNTFSELFYSLAGGELPGAVIVSVFAGLAIWLWRDYRNLPLRSFVPRELFAVLVGVVCTMLLTGTPFELSPEHRVSIPRLGEVGGLKGLWTSPDLAAIGRLDVWRTAFTLAMVASIESLLCVEATDRIDPLHRASSPNRELLAQGLGNAASGALGGLPVTAVVVRSFANVQAGAKSRWSTVTHGVLLGLATLFAAHLLNFIPLAALAVVLMVVGYKLTPPKLYREIWELGTAQFFPFITTVLAILLTDLLTGTLLGIGFSVFFVLWGQYRSAIVVTDDGEYRMIRFISSVSFLHKPRLREALETAAPGTQIILDGTRAHAVDPDIMDTIREFEAVAQGRGVTLSITRTRTALHGFFREDEARA